MQREEPGDLKRARDRAEDRERRQQLAGDDLRSPQWIDFEHVEHLEIAAKIEPQEKRAEDHHAAREHEKSGSSRSTRRSEGMPGGKSEERAEHDHQADDQEA